MPFAVAAKAVNPNKPVIAIVGDSAFGFSAMELDTASRYNLPLVVIIINNNGIYSVFYYFIKSLYCILKGVESINIKGENNEIPVTALNPDAKYEKVIIYFYIF